MEGVLVQNKECTKDDYDRSTIIGEDAKLRA